MNREKFLSKMDWLLAQNRLLGFVILILLAFNVMNWGSLLYMQAKTLTVVVPVGSEAMEIGNGKANQNYIRRMARYVINQLGTYSAGSARQQFQEVVTLWAPEKVTEAAKFFDGLAAEVERYPSIASNTIWTGQTPLKYTSKMIQVQTLHERIVNGNVKDRKQVFSCIEYRIEDAHFFIVDIKEKEEAGVDLCLLEAAPAASAAGADAVKQP